MIIANLTLGNTQNFYKEIEVNIPIPSYSESGEQACAMINKYNAIELIKHLTNTFDITEKDIESHEDYQE